MYCDKCNLTFGKAEKKVRIYNKYFHEACMLKILKEKQPLQLEVKQERR